MSLSACTCRAGQTRHPRARVRVQIRRNARPMNRTEIGSRASERFPEENAGFAIQISLPHHRAFHAGAVLSVVNARRFASTRPAAGPSGIDDASARHVSGSCAMEVSVLAPRTRLTRDFGRRILMYRVCAPTAHPPHRTQCMQSAFPGVALRARFKRTTTTSRQAATPSRCA